MPTGNGHGPGLWDVTGREYLIILPLVAAILFLGVYPKPVLARINPSARQTCVFVRDNDASSVNHVIQSPRTSESTCNVGNTSSPPPEPSPSPSMVPLAQQGGGP